MSYDKKLPFSIMYHLLMLNFNVTFGFGEKGVLENKLMSSFFRYVNSEESRTTLQQGLKVIQT